MKYVHLEKEDLDELKELAKSKTLRELKEYYGCSHTTILYHLKKWGMKPCPKKNPAYDNAETIVRLWNEGKNGREIAEAINADRYDVYLYINLLRRKKYNLKSHKRQTISE